MTRAGRLRWWWVAALALAGAAAPLSAQDAPRGEVVDRVVAVVGNRPVLQSQVDEELFARQSQGLKLPTDPKALEALRRQVLSELIDEELLVQQALRDTAIKVTDEEINEGVEQQVRKVRQNFGSDAEYRADLKRAGFQTPEEYRRWLFDQQRRAALQNRLTDRLKQSGKLKPVPPTEREMQAYFRENKDRLGRRPATISFRQIVIAPKPDSAARARAWVLADSIARAIRGGADFATAARRFSQDPGSREQGGDLNWFRRGQMVPEFERVAFALRPGVVSDPVESPFGMHVIQVQRVQPAEVQARHILIIPELAPANIEAASTRATEVHDALVQGASFDSLQRLVHDPGEEKEASDVPMAQLPPSYQGVFDAAAKGAVSRVFELKGAGEGQVKFAVAIITDRKLEGEIQYEDVKDRIRDALAQQLTIRRYIDRLRAATYVEVRSL